MICSSKGELLCDIKKRAALQARRPDAWRCRTAGTSRRWPVRNLRGGKNAPAYYFWSSAIALRKLAMSSFTWPLLLLNQDQARGRFRATILGEF